jgi:hypothetical protein
LGYKLIDGKVEDSVHYFKRMSGVLHLYFTLLMSMESMSNSKSQFDGVKRAWKWLVDVLNMTPRASITAEMLAIFFKCCGHKMHRVYGTQFVKLVQVCSSDYLQLIKTIPIEKQSQAPVGRLETILEEFLRNRQFTEWKNPN